MPIDSPAYPLARGWTWLLTAHRRMVTAPLFRRISANPWHWVEATVTAGSAGPPARAEILVDFSTRARLLWGGANSTGTPCLDPALVVDVSPSLPEQSGPWTLEGQDTGGRVLFTLPLRQGEA